VGVMFDPDQWQARPVSTLASDADRLAARGAW
jgi:hypothetical protein